MIRFVFALFIVLFLLSCGKEVEIKTSSEPRQVLSAFFSDLTDTLNLYISNSASLSGNESKGISTAEVCLFENGVKVFDFESKGDGFYRIAKGAFVFKEGKEYEITSKVNGLPDIFAKAIFVPEVKLDSLVYEKLSDRHSLIDMWFQDPDETNYYGFFMVQYFINSSISYTIEDQVSIQGVDYYDEIVSDALFNGQAIKSHLLVENFEQVDKLGTPGTKIKGIMMNTERIWYEYEQAAAYNVADPDDLFPVVSTTNLPTNVLGGYGIFALGNASIIEKFF